MYGFCVVRWSTCTCKVLHHHNLKEITMGNFRTISNHRGEEVVLRVTSAPSLKGGTDVRRTQRKARGRKLADALELRYASKIDFKEERRVGQLLDRRSKRKG